MISWFNNENFKIIPSTKNYSVNELVLANIRYEYTLDYQNYYFAFMIRVPSPTGGFIQNEDLSNYITFSFSHRDQKGVTTELEYENCYAKYQDNFLGLNEEILRNDGETRALSMLTLTT